MQFFIFSESNSNELDDRIFSNLVGLELFAGEESIFALARVPIEPDLLTLPDLSLYCLSFKAFN